MFNLSAVRRGRYTCSQMSQQASKQIAVMGRRWDGGAPVHRLALEGQSLEREKNPALALKMLAGALGNR